MNCVGVLPLGCKEQGQIGFARACGRKSSPGQRGDWGDRRAKGRSQQTPRLFRRDPS